jgi:glycosyltransferase involved in cell wall biosynthesis
MKIIQILCGKANPGTTMSGVNMVVDTYARLLHEAGQEVEVWGIAGNPDSNLPEPEYPIKFFRHHHDWPRSLDPGLRACAADADPSTTVWHFHSAFLPDFPALTGINPAVPYLCMPHGLYADAAIRRKRWRKSMYFSIREAPWLRRSSGLVLLSERELGRRAAQALQSVPRYVVPNGADPAAAGVRCVGDRPGGHVEWGFIGRVSEAQKSVRRMVRCFMRMREADVARTHRLVIIGDGEDLEDIRRQHAADIAAGYLVFAGALYGADKFRRMCGFDYLLLLSRWEGQPLGLLDALALGIPAVVTPETNLGVEIEAAGAGVVAVGSDAAVVAAMREIQTRDRAAMSAAARRLAHSQFNWSASVARLLAVYRQVLQSRQAVTGA